MIKKVTEYYCDLCKKKIQGKDTLHKLYVPVLHSCLDNNSYIKCDEVELCSSCVNEVTVLQTDDRRKLLSLKESHEKRPYICENHSQNTCSKIINTETLAAAIASHQLNRILSPFDEIDIHLYGGKKITVICAYSNQRTARFLFKEYWDKSTMNDYATSKGGYYKSKGRQHVLKDIYPLLPQEWKNLIKPREIIERNGKYHHRAYKDPLWLPSATDIYGVGDKFCFYKDFDDSFQLPICRDEHFLDLIVKRNTYWLRTPSIEKESKSFETLTYKDNIVMGFANSLYCFLPGFDI